MAECPGDRTQLQRRAPPHTKLFLIEDARTLMHQSPREYRLNYNAHRVALGPDAFAVRRLQDRQDLDRSHLKIYRKSSGGGPNRNEPCAYSQWMQTRYWHDSCSSLAFASEGNSLIVGGASGTMIWGRGGECRELKLARQRNKPAALLTVSHDGKYVCSKLGDGNLALWNLAGTDSQGSVLRGSQGEIRKIHFMYWLDRVCIAALNSHGKFYVWDVANHKRLYSSALPSDVDRTKLALSTTGSVAFTYPLPLHELGGSSTVTIRGM